MGFKLEKIIKKELFGITSYTVMIRPSGLTRLQYAFRVSLPKEPVEVRQLALDGLKTELDSIDTDRLYVHFSVADGGYCCQYQVREP